MHTLEQEFTEAVKRHKYEMIAASLTVFEKDGIYNHPLLNDKYGTLEGNGVDKACEVTDDLKKRSQEGEDDLYDEIYQMCWDNIKYVIDDTKAYGIPSEKRMEPIGELKHDYK